MPFTDVYEMFSESIMLLAMILLYHYVYMEPGFARKKSLYIFVGSYLAVLFGLRLIPGRPEAAEFLCPVVFFCLYVFCTRKRKRLRGIFLFLPISGYLFMLVAASTSFYCVFTGAKSSEGFNYVMDAVFCLALLVFWKWGGRFRKRVKNEQEYRSLRRGERWLLNLGGIFIFVMAVILIGILENVSGDEIRGDWKSLFLMTGSISISLLTAVMIAFVMQGSRKEYYQREAQLTEWYLHVELEHFKAYRQAQQEVRRVRHDIDNALEYLEQSALKDKWIRVKISGQGNMWLFRFENPVENSAKILPSGATKKDDSSWHGFGIINMERTTEKYMGHIERYIKEDVCCLEAVLFTTK